MQGNTLKKLQFYLWVPSAHGKISTKGVPRPRSAAALPTTFGPLFDLYGSRCGIFMDNWTSTHARRGGACSGDGIPNQWDRNLYLGWDGVILYIPRLNNRGGHSFILAPMQINRVNCLTLKDISLR